jgi:hypothetical protein
MSWSRRNDKKRTRRVEQMIRDRLRNFVNCVVEAQRITDDDVRHLSRIILSDGLSSRKEAEILMMLGRTLPADPGWADLLSVLVVDLVVWGSRPTGKVSREDAVWLAALLDAAAPSKTALRIVQAVVAEADEVDEALIAFALRSRHTARTLAA